MDKFLDWIIEKVWDSPKEVKTWHILAMAVIIVLAKIAMDLWQ